MDVLLLWASKLVPILVYPLTISCFLLAGSLLARSARSARALVVLALGVLWLGSCGPVARAAVRSLELRYAPLPGDVTTPLIVLLGGAALPAVSPRTGVELSAEADRIVYAARLWHEQRAPKILIAAGVFDPAGVRRAEADDIAEVLRALGVPDEAMILERRSRNTYENAVEAHHLLGGGSPRILLVTSALHMPRSVGVFRAQGFDVTPAPVDYLEVDRAPVTSRSAFVWRLLLDLTPDAGSLQNLTQALREWLGIAVYWMQGRLMVSAQ